LLALLGEAILHLLLVGGQNGLFLLIIVVFITRAVTIVHTDLLALGVFGLDLNLEELDQKDGQRVVGVVYHEAVENATIASQQEVLEGLLVLLHKERLDNLVEVTAED
jgi:hypothetical protein